MQKASTVVALDVSVPPVVCCTGRTRVQIPHVARQDVLRDLPVQPHETLTVSIHDFPNVLHPDLEFGLEVEVGLGLSALSLGCHLQVEFLHVEFLLVLLNLVVVSVGEEVTEDTEIHLGVQHTLEFWISLVPRWTWDQSSSWKMTAAGESCCLCLKLVPGTKKYCPLIPVKKTKYYVFETVSSFYREFSFRIEFRGFIFQMENIALTPKQETFVNPAKLTEVHKIMNHSM